MTMLIKNKCSASDYIILGVDTTAHLAEFDGNSNVRGILPESHCGEDGPINLNRTDICRGRKTRCNSFIDYKVANVTAYLLVDMMTF